jgi:hypothetical protein
MRLSEDGEILNFQPDESKWPSEYRSLFKFVNRVIGRPVVEFEFEDKLPPELPACLWRGLTPSANWGRTRKAVRASTHVLCTRAVACSCSTLRRRR